MSLKKIAQLTNTSVSTVSRVLNNPGYRCQNKELADKIHKTARQMNYTPNINARQLKLYGAISETEEKKGYVFDVLLARFDHLGEDPFFTEVFNCIETQCFKQNASLGQIYNVPEITNIIKKNRKSDADGILILGKCRETMVDDLKKVYKALLAIDRNPMEYKIDEVVCSGERAAVLAMDYLFSLGHIHIGYVGDCNMEARYTGYYESLSQRKIPLTYDYIVSTTMTKEEGYRAFEKLSKLNNPPSAVFCANDATALGFVEAIKEKNGRKKKGVYRPAVVSIDDIEMASESSPMLTTVHIPKEDMAHLSVMLLKDRLDGGHVESMRVELPCSLMIRESAGMSVI